LGSGSPGSSKPSGKSFATEIAHAQAVQESTARYRQATSPKPTYTDPKGVERRIDPADKQVQVLRREVTPEKYATRSDRGERVFGPTYRNPPPATYSDPFGPWFYLWLFDRCTAGERANWAYHHRSQIDSARWADMVRRDAELEARVKQLEAGQTPRDPAYVPPPLKDNPDLMYKDEYVSAVWNPQSAQGSSGTQTAYRPAEQAHRSEGFPWGAVLLCLVLLAAVCALFWWWIAKQMLKSRQNRPSAGKDKAKPGGYNPLAAKCGAFVAVDELDFRGKNFRVVEIRQCDHQIGGKHYAMVDYVLQADQQVARLRVVPSGEQWRAMLLSLYDDLAYDEGLHNVVRDDTLKFVVDDAEAGLHEEYWRVEDVRGSYKANVTVLQGDDPNAAPAVSRVEVEYWDYWRDTEVDGVKVTQYLYVEMNTETGWFQIWRGMETEPERILVT
jgi:hypothetical protein